MVDVLAVLKVVPKVFATVALMVDESVISKVALMVASWAASTAALWANVKVVQLVASMAA